MTTVALQQVSSKFARENAGKTLDRPIASKYVKRFLTEDQFGKIESECPDGKIFVWGAKLERSHQFEKILPRRCLVLFRHGSSVYKCGVVFQWVVNLELAEYLWGNDIDGEIWGLVYFMKNAKDISIPASEINRLIGRIPKNHWQGLIAVSPPASDVVIQYVKTEIAVRGRHE